LFERGQTDRRNPVVEIAMSASLLASGAYVAIKLAKEIAELAVRHEDRRLFDCLIFRLDLSNGN